jgi:predicted DsbA family dithiol-disulfide isomerase
VPTFVIEGRWAIPGAQDVDTFVQVLQRAAERLASTPRQ